MRIRSAILTAVAAAALSACSDSGITNPPVSGVFLKDIVIPNLPSPYYHFEYDASGRVLGASFASGARSYNLTYDGGRLSEMQNNAGNRDRLDYVYDNDGRVALVKYVDESGSVYTTVFLTYSGGRLTELERDRKVTGGYIIDKTMTFAYDAAGNVSEITVHLPAIDGVQTEATYTDRYEQYDNKLNVDGFSLIHSEFNDHLVLLPGVVFQRGNPARATHTGDGDNYTVDYTYTYDRNRPLTKTGDLVFTSGTLAGRHYQLSSQFSYY